MGNNQTKPMEQGARKSRLVVLLCAASWSLAACGKDCEDEIEAARAFLDNPANLGCQTSDDCVVVNTGCHTFERGICSQAQLSKAAAASASWAEMSADLNDCEDGCAVCAAGLSVQCTDGFCGGAP